MKALKMIVPCLMLLGVCFIGCETQTCMEVNNPDCVCIEIAAPVCGCNDKTYGNSCKAECAGITEYSDGPCN